MEEIQLNNIFLVGEQLSSENIQIVQNSDDSTTDIIKKIKDKDPSTCQRYFLDSHTNLLMYKFRHKKTQIWNKIYIPKSLIKDCLHIAHAPHFGVQKTYEFIKSKYYWPGMYADVKNFVDNCSNCIQNKPKRKTLTSFIPKHHLAPGEFLAIDIVGKLPRSIDNQNYILTIVDHYSRFLEAIPIPNTSSKTIIKHLNYYFSRYGIPKFILSDNATYFKSDEIVDFYKSLKIEHRKASIYYPQSNGLLERAHRILKESVKSISHKVHDWSNSLLFFKLHYNNSKHLVTQYTPAELFFGRKTNIPLASYDHPKYVEDFSEYLNNIQEQLRECNNRVKENENDYFSKHKKYIKGCIRDKLQLGDKVFMEVFVEPNVLQPKYKGPFEITKVFRNDNYLVKMTEDDHTKYVKVHISKIFKQPNLRVNLRED